MAATVGFLDRILPEINPFYCCTQGENHGTLRDSKRFVHAVWVQLRGGSLQASDRGLFTAAKNYVLL